jgi:hypothetical protein
MHKQAAEELEAVFLFGGEQLSREMLYPEFEAILDGFVPVPDYAGQTAKAVFVRINADLCITAAVFFLLDFDNKGMVDRRWNVPLEQLLSAAGRGPDLGAGPIALVCFSQCPVEWQQKNLWDPFMEPGRNHFVAMRKAAKFNRLGLVFKEPAYATPKAAELQAKQQEQLQKKLHQQYSQAHRDRMAQALKEQRLRITTLVNQQQKKLKSLQQEHQQRLQAYQEQLKVERQENAELQKRVESFRESLDSQVQKIDGVREYYTHKLKALQSGESSQLQAMQESYALEVSARVEAAVAELQEKLDMREVELFYRHQQETNLRDEIARLREENQRLLAAGGDQLLSRLNKVGVSFVVFHPGAGHMTIAPEDMGSYLESPRAFAADKCGVSETVYAAWLVHYQAPQCQAHLEGGGICGASLTRVIEPSDFLEGESNRCSEHRVMPSRKVVGQE